MRRPLFSLVPALTFLALLACDKEIASYPEGDSTHYDASEGGGGARLAGALEGFYSPEAVRYDADQDVFFIANMLGYGSDKDGAGYIIRVDASKLGKNDIFAESGKNGVKLDAPKGMAIQGDTLWVNDIDVVRGFNRKSGAPVGTIDLRPYGAVLLNDIDVGPDGALHITDSGIIMGPAGVLHPGGDKVFAVGAGRVVSVTNRGDQLGRPNGITYDNAGKRWLVVSFDPFRSEVYTVNDADTSRKVLYRGHGKFDGVAALADGRILVSAWSDSSLHMFANGTDRRIVRNLITPADIAVDTRRNRVAIPLVMLNRVEFWDLPKS
jgi:hypothetical protein